MRVLYVCQSRRSLDLKNVADLGLLRHYTSAPQPSYSPPSSAANCSSSRRTSSMSSSIGAGCLANANQVSSPPMRTWTCQPLPLDALQPLQPAAFWGSRGNDLELKLS